MLFCWIQKMYIGNISVRHTHTHIHLEKCLYKNQIFFTFDSGSSAKFLLLGVHDFGRFGCGTGRFWLRFLFFVLDRCCVFVVLLTVLLLLFPRAFFRDEVWRLVVLTFALSGSNMCSLKKKKKKKKMIAFNREYFYILRNNVSTILLNNNAWKFFATVI